MTPTEETLERLRRGDAVLFTDPSLPLEVLGGAVTAESIRLGAARYLASRPTCTHVPEGTDAWMIDLAHAWWQSEWDGRQMALVLGLRARRDGLRSPAHRRHVRALLLCARTALPLAGEWSSRLESHLTALEQAVSGDSSIDLVSLDRALADACLEADHRSAKHGQRASVKSRRTLSTTDAREALGWRQAALATESAYAAYCSATMPWEMQASPDEDDAAPLASAAKAWSLLLEQDGVSIVDDGDLFDEHLADMADLLRAALPTWSAAFP